MRKPLSLLIAAALLLPAGLSWSIADVDAGWPASVNPAATDPGNPPKRPIAYFAKHVAQMRANHPGAGFETLGYTYQSDPANGVITGIQVRVAGPNIFNPCFFLAVLNPGGKTTAGSCRGN